MWIPQVGYVFSPADVCAPAEHGRRPPKPLSAAARHDRSGRALAGSTVRAH
jgi:hypothetical protein